MIPQETEARTYAMLQEWDAAKTVAEEAVAKEKELRKAIVDLVGDKEIAKGIEYIPLNNDYKLKITKASNYNVDQNTVRLQLSEIASKGDNGQSIASRLMKWSAKLSLTEYKTLPQEFKEIINRCITVTDSTPTIEIVAPSTKGRARAKEGFQL